MATTIPWPDRFLLLEAALRLLAARLLVALPFRFVSRRLGNPGESPFDDPPAIVRRIRWAVVAIGRRAPWRCECLEQAIAAKMMLRARRVPNTLYLGVALPGNAAVPAAEQAASRRPGAGRSLFSRRGRRRSDNARAHAWLRSGSLFVTGGDGSGRFAVVSSFSDD